MGLVEGVKLNCAAGMPHTNWAPPKQQATYLKTSYGDHLKLRQNLRGNAGFVYIVSSFRCFRTEE